MNFIEITEGGQKNRIDLDSVQGAHLTLSFREAWVEVRSARHQPAKFVFRNRKDAEDALKRIESALKWKEHFERGQKEGQESGQSVP